MQRRSRLIWGFLLVVSAAWILLGTFFTSEHYDGGNLGQELSREIQSVGGEAEIGALAELPLPVFFLATGLPIALVALFLLWRGIRRGSASKLPEMDTVKQRSPSKPLDANSVMRRQALFATLLALLFAFLLWNMGGAPGGVGSDVVSGTSAHLLWPVRLFVTFIHEAGHSVAALITGGQVKEFTVSPNGSGLAVTSGGDPALILPAGYLGAALFGSVLFYLTSRHPYLTRGLSVFLGLSVIILTVAFARPDQAGNFTANVIGIGFGVGLVALGWSAPDIVNVFILNTLALLTGLNAVIDVSYLVRHPDAGIGEIMNDAAAFANAYTPLLPASVIAFIWSAVAVLMLGAAVYFGLLKQVGGEISEAVNGKN